MKIEIKFHSLNNFIVDSLIFLPCNAFQTTALFWLIILVADDSILS